MTRVRIWFAVGIALVLGLGAQSALATSFTLAADIPFNDAGSGASGTLKQVFDESGGSVCLDGVCAGDVLLFLVELDTGSLDQVSVSSGFSFNSGAGHFSDPDVTPSSATRPFNLSAEFNFGAPNLVAVGVSDRLFVNFSSTLSEADPVQFMLQPVGDLIFDVTGSITVIPEPNALVLASLGFAGLALASRRRIR